MTVTQSSDINLAVFKQRLQQVEHLLRVSMTRQLCTIRRRLVDVKVPVRRLFTQQQHIQQTCSHTAITIKFTTLHICHYHYSI